jgi:hypothetical protein
MSAPAGEEVPSPLPGRMVRVGLGMAFAEVAGIWLGAFLASGSFALAADASSLPTCLAAVPPKLPWPNLCPTLTKAISEMRGRGEKNFWGTWEKGGLPASSVTLVVIRSELSRGLIVVGDRWRRPSSDPPSLHAKAACADLLGS